MSELRASAVLFGLALGDALGWPTEFKDMRQIWETYGPQGIQEPPDPALFTDDTQMTIALTEGLLDAGLDAPLDQQMVAISKRFVEWRNSPENNRAPGKTCMMAVRRLADGLPWYETGVYSKECGSAMRVAAIGYLYQYDPARLIEVARVSGRVTHTHPTAEAASIAAAYAVKLALDDVPVSEFLPRLFAVTEGISEEFEQALRLVGHVGAWGDEIAAMDHIGQGWTGEEAVALALYCVIRYPDDYVACVRRAANSSGDSDSIACIAGGIMGARLGLDAIPAAWIARCEHREALHDLAHRMAEARRAVYAR